jgi:DNA-binding SARP family transcriptional activator
VLPADLLADRLWSGNPPASAQGGLQVHVSNLRRRLEPDQRPGATSTVLVSAVDGYGLMTGGLGLDTRDFERLRSAGSGQLAEGRHTEAAAALAAALDLWRGDPYADVRSEGWAPTRRSAGGRVPAMRPGPPCGPGSRSCATSPPPPRRPPCPTRWAGS